MVKGDVSMGKEIIPNYIASCTNLPKLLLGKSIVLEQSMVNLYSNFVAFEKCFSLSHVMLLTALNHHQRYISSFSLDPVSMTSFDNQFCTLFPRVGDNSGYCGEEFHEAPPQDSTYGLNE